MAGSNLERYQRNIEFFGWVQTTPNLDRFEAQARLHRARVLIVGLGGSGSSAALALAAAGVGALHVVDPDVVELSNPSRQVIYTEADVGHTKADRAASRLAALNSAVNITSSTESVESPDAFTRLLADRNLMVLCADEPADTIAQWANRAAIANRTPSVTALYAGPAVSVASSSPERRPATSYWRTRERPWPSLHGSVRVRRQLLPSSALRWHRRSRSGQPCDTGVHRDPQWAATGTRWLLPPEHARVDAHLRGQNGVPGPPSGVRAPKRLAAPLPSARLASRTGGRRWPSPFVLTSLNAKEVSAMTVLEIRLLDQVETEAALSTPDCGRA